MLQLLLSPVFLALAPATIIPVVAIIAVLSSKAYRHGLDASLKREMIQRGYSPDDIVKVLQAPKVKGENLRQSAAEDAGVHAHFNFVRR
jgi:hypothetical protein